MMVRPSSPDPRIRSTREIASPLVCPPRPLEQSKGLKGRPWVKAYNWLITQRPVDAIRDTVFIISGPDPNVCEDVVCRNVIDADWASGSNRG